MRTHQDLGFVVLCQRMNRSIRISHARTYYHLALSSLLQNFKNILLLATLFLITLCGCLAHQDSPKGAAAIDKDAAVTNLRGGGEAESSQENHRNLSWWCDGWCSGSCSRMWNCGSCCWWWVRESPPIGMVDWGVGNKPVRREQVEDLLVVCVWIGFCIT